MYDAAKLVREEILEIIVQRMLEKIQTCTVRLHDGDPSIYGAIKEQIDNLEKIGIKSVVMCQA